VVDGVLTSYNKYIFSIKEVDSIFLVSQGDVLFVKGGEGAGLLRSALLDASLSYMKRVGIFDHSFQTPSFIKKRTPERILCRAHEIRIEGILYAFDVRDSINSIAFDKTFGEVTGLHSRLVSYLLEHGSYQCDSTACALQERSLGCRIKDTVPLQDTVHEFLYVVVEEYESKKDEAKGFDDHLLWKLREERNRGAKRVVIDRTLERLGDEIQDEKLLEGAGNLGVVLRTILSSTESLHETLEMACREAMAESTRASKVVLYMFQRSADTGRYEYFNHTQLSEALFCTTCRRSFSFREVRHTPGETILEEVSDKIKCSIDDYTFPELHVDTFTLKSVSQSIGEIVKTCTRHVPEELRKDLAQYISFGLSTVPLSCSWAELTEYQRLMCYLSRLSSQDLVRYVLIIDASVVTRASWDDFFTGVEAVRKNGAIVIILYADEKMIEDVLQRNEYRIFDYIQGRFREDAYCKSAKVIERRVFCDNEKRAALDTVAMFSGMRIEGGIVPNDTQGIVNFKKSLGDTSIYIHASMSGSQVLLRGNAPNLFLPLGVKGTVFTCDRQMIIDALGISGKVVSLFSKTLKARVDGIDDSDFIPGGSLSCSFCEGRGYFSEESILGYLVAEICIHCKGSTLSEKSSKYQSMGVNMSELLQMNISDARKILEGEIVPTCALSILNHFELGSVPLGSFFFSFQKEDKIKFLLSLAAILSESSPIVFHAETLFSEMPTSQKQHYFDLLSPWFSKGKSSLRI
jgi:N-acetylglutamate synthase-like GNAT family acetyltransferase